MCIRDRLYTLRTGGVQAYERREARSSEGRIARRLTAAVWRRLQKAYPGIREMSPEEQEIYPFAKGVCLDKLVWVFLTSALLGDVIETFWCGLVNGHWMSRSSVLYGPFSFVWGLGAVVLTVTLQGLAHRDSFFVFAAGFFIGGTYEYMCLSLIHISGEDNCPPAVAAVVEGPDADGVPGGDEFAGLAVVEDARCV